MLLLSFMKQYHPSGTCAMGPKDSNDSVVDSELRVIGTRGLRVIDASIMVASLSFASCYNFLGDVKSRRTIIKFKLFLFQPFITIGNTNAPTIMIGEMGANFIKAQWTEVNKIK